MGNVLNINTWGDTAVLAFQPYLSSKLEWFLGQDVSPSGRGVNINTWGDIGTQFNVNILLLVVGATDQKYSTMGLRQIYICLA